MTKLDAVISTEWYKSFIIETTQQGIRYRYCLWYEGVYRCCLSVEEAKRRIDISPEAIADAAEKAYWMEMLNALERGATVETPPRTSAA